MMTKIERGVNNLAFNWRAKYGKEWEDDCFCILEDIDEVSGVVPMGAERICPNAQVILSGMVTPDSTAKLVRYFPDGFAVIPNRETAFFFEAKRASAIEKEAYLNYVAMAGSEMKFLLMIKHERKENRVVVKTRIYFAPIQQVVLYEPDPKTTKFPIDEDGWIAPRLLPPSEYESWKRLNPQASGTPHKYFNFTAMKKFEQFPEKGYKLPF